MSLKPCFHMIVAVIVSICRRLIRYTSPMCRSRSPCYDHMETRLKTKVLACEIKRTIVTFWVILRQQGQKGKDLTMYSQILLIFHLRLKHLDSSNRPMGMACNRSGIAWHTPPLPKECNRLCPNGLIVCVQNLQESSGGSDKISCP